MSRENRAKQFMPFAALKGLEEALEKKEKIVVPKAELCDDYKEQLDFRLSQMQCGDMVTAVYFSEEDRKKTITSVSPAFYRKSN